MIRDRAGTLDLDEVLSRPLFAHLATASDAGPRESPVWFLWEDGALWILGNTRTDTFPARIRQEPRCAVGVVDFDLERGRVHHVGLRGHGAVVPFDRARAIRLLSRYLGPPQETWDPRFRQSLGDSENVIVRFEPGTVVVRDQSYEPKLGKSRRRPIS